MEGQNEKLHEIVFEENIDSDLLNQDFENVQEITNQISKYERKENISVNSCETVMNKEYISVNLPVNSCETVMNKENISVNPMWKMPCYNLFIIYFQLKRFSL
jgi:hypothetical protein